MPTISLTRPQFEFYQLGCRYPLFVAGYGAGKTHALITRAVADLNEAPNARVAIYSDTYDQLRLNIIPRMEDMLTQFGISYTYNRSENTMTIGERMLIFRSIDNPRRIIGYEVFRSHVDELEAGTTPDKAADVWRRIIARNRQQAPGRENRVACYTTPDQGFGFTYDRWGKQAGDEYRFVRASTRSNPFLPDDYYEALTSDYPEELADAYIEGHWCNLRTGTVYGAFDRDACNTPREVKDGEPLHIGMDFNVHNMAAVIGVRAGEVLHVVDELIGYRDTPAIIEAIRDRYAGHVVNIYPDASGASTSSQDASRSDIILLKEAGFVVRAKKRNPRVRDRIVCVNRRFEEQRLRVNVTRCPQLVEALEQQAYDAKGEPDKSSGHDHQCDAIGYLCTGLMPLRLPARREAVWYK